MSALSTTATTSFGTFMRSDGGGGCVVPGHVLWGRGAVKS